MRTYYTLAAVLLSAILFFALGRSTVPVPKPTKAPPSAKPSPKLPAAKESAVEAKPEARNPAKDPPIPVRPDPPARKTAFEETILEGTGTADFVIEEVLYRDHPIGNAHLEREVVITYRNDANLTRVFTIHGGTREHKILLPPNDAVEKKVVRGRMSLSKKDGKAPPFVAAGCGYDAKPLPALGE